MENIPVQIRPHLIPFLFKEMEGTEAGYMNKTVKSIKIYPFSSIGKFLYSQLSDFKKIGKRDQFIIYLTIEKKSLNVYYGYLYVSINKVTEMVYLQESKVKEINNLFEDIFRISFVYYIEGYMEHNPNKEIILAIDKFIDKYDLLELGFTNEGLRRLYYREKTKNNKLSRMQYLSATRVVNFDIESPIPSCSLQTMSHRNL